MLMAGGWTSGPVSGINHVYRPPTGQMQRQFCTRLQRLKWELILLQILMFIQIF